MIAGSDAKILLVLLRPHRGQIRHFQCVIKQALLDFKPNDDVFDRSDQSKLEEEEKYEIAKKANTNKRICGHNKSHPHIHIQQTKEATAR